MKRSRLFIIAIIVLIIGYFVVNNLFMTEEKAIIKVIERTEKQINKAKSFDELELEYNATHELYWENENPEIKERMLDLYMVYSDKKEKLESELNRENKIVAYTAAQMAIREILRSPSTAEFENISDAKYINKGNNKHTIVLWVDAQNAFGATVRETYLVSLTGNEQNMKSTDISKIK